MATQPKSYLTPEEYLALERQAEYRSEYVDGEMVAMTGTSSAHNRITRNLIRRLDEALEDGPCEPFVAEIRVRILHRRYYYPDVVVVCGEAEFEDDELDTLLNPTVVFEVLSKSTQNYDRGEKAEFHRALPSLRELVFVSQYRVHVEHMVRQAEREWVLAEYDSLDDTLVLPTLRMRLPLAHIYRRVLPPEQTEHGPD
ncbi:MAG: Uma2 family endonuclease [Anaerolineae bacterium]|nr:Uma2 family endonuclease [Anaerolineae bacterium]